MLCLHTERRERPLGAAGKEGQGEWGRQERGGRGDSCALVFEHGPEQTWTLLANPGACICGIILA